LRFSVAAVALGAKVIEKHYTIDKSLPGPDHKASLDPTELKTLVDQIRNVERAIAGSGTKQLHSSEIETKKVVQKGIYLTKDIAVGEIITDDCLIMKRPVTQLSANDYDLVIGKKTSKAIKEGAALNLTDLSFE